MYALGERGDGVLRSKLTLWAKKGERSAFIRLP